MAKINAGILGTGHSYPEGILTNADLEKIVDTSDEWITTRTGIKQRRKAAPGEYTSLFAVRAAQERYKPQVALAVARTAWSNYWELYVEAEEIRRRVGAASSRLTGSPGAPHG